MLAQETKIPKSLEFARLWIQYLAARVLIQMPLFYQGKSLREWLYEETFQLDRVSPELKIMLTKAFADMGAICWDRKFLLAYAQNFIEPPQLSSEEKKLLYVGLAHLLISRDANSQKALLNLLQNTQDRMLQCWILYKLPEYECNFGREQLFEIWEQMKRSSDAKEKAFGLLITQTVYRYLQDKIDQIQKKTQILVEKEQYYRGIIYYLVACFQDTDINIQKIAITLFMKFTDIKPFLHKPQIIALIEEKYQRAEKDLEMRLLCLALLGFLETPNKLRETLEEKMPFLEKMAFWYGVGQCTDLSVYLPAFGSVLSQLTNLSISPTSQGLILTAVCYFSEYFYIGLGKTHRRILQNQLNAVLKTYLNGTNHERVHWALLGFVSLKEVEPDLYKQITELVEKISLPLEIRHLALSTLCCITLKQKMPEHTHWHQMLKEKLQKGPQEARKLLDIATWSYKQIISTTYSGHFKHDPQLLPQAEAAEILEYQLMSLKKELMDPNLIPKVQLALENSLELFYFYASLYPIDSSWQQEVFQRLYFLSVVYERAGQSAKASACLEQQDAYLQNGQLAWRWYKLNPDKINQFIAKWTNYSHDRLFDQAIFLRIQAQQYLEKQEDQINALKILENQYILAPDDPLALSTLAEYSRQIKQFEKAESILMEILYSKPYKGHALWLLVELYVEINQLELAYDRLESLARHWIYPLTPETIKKLPFTKEQQAKLWYLFARKAAANRCQYEMMMWLELAVAYGYHLVETQVVKEFQPYRNDPDFKKLWGKITK